MNGFQGEAQFGQSGRGELGEAGWRGWERPPALSPPSVAKSLDISPPGRGGAPTGPWQCSEACAGVQGSQGSRRRGTWVFPLIRRDPLGRQEKWLSMKELGTQGAEGESRGQLALSEDNLKNPGLPRCTGVAFRPVLPQV